jgi:hypothetical protein
MLLKQIACDIILPGKVKYYGRVLKPISFMALVHKAADEKKIHFFKYFGAE